MLFLFGSKNTWHTQILTKSLGIVRISGGFWVKALEMYWFSANFLGLNQLHNAQFLRYKFFFRNNYHVTRGLSVCKFLCHIFHAAFRTKTTQNILYIRRLMVSTDQADPGCFYFRISWILMEWRWFYFFHPLHLI